MIEIPMEERKDRFGVPYACMDLPKLLKLIFPDHHIEDNLLSSVIEGVCFKTIKAPGYGPLNVPGERVGLRLSFEDPSTYRDTTRKVKFKDGMVDEEKVKTKFKELLALKEKADQAYRELQDRKEKERSLREKLQNEFDDSVKLEVEYTDQVSLKLSGMTADQAREVFKLYQSFKEENKDA